MTFVDTGYLVALASPRDQHHAKAFAWAGVVDEPLVLTEYVLVESVNHLAGLGLRRQALDVGDAASAGDGQFLFVPASAELLAAGLQMFRQHADKRWSLTDCISFHVMRDRGLTRALAHDRHFAQAGFDPLLRRDP